MGVSEGEAPGDGGAAAAGPSWAQRLLTWPEQELALASSWQRSQALCLSSGAALGLEGGGNHACCASQLERQKFWDPHLQNMGEPRKLCGS